jgi:hypothetical protein
VSAITSLVDDAGLPKAGAWAGKKFSPAAKKFHNRREPTHRRVCSSSTIGRKDCADLNISKAQGANCG